jgi:hypothetical protein
MSRLVMGQELRAAIAEATRDRRYVARNELYKHYFRNADWERFKDRLSISAAEGLVTVRPHPEDPGDRLVGLSDEARELRVSTMALARGRQRRGELDG